MEILEAHPIFKLELGPFDLLLLLSEFDPCRDHHIAGGLSVLGLNYFVNIACDALDQFAVPSEVICLHDRVDVRLGILDPEKRTLLLVTVGLFLLLDRYGLLDCEVRSIDYVCLARLACLNEGHAVVVESDRLSTLVHLLKYVFSLFEPSDASQQALDLLGVHVLLVLALL